MGYYAGFPRPIPHLKARRNALLALPPLSPIAGFSFDLHALATPPAFNLSQDQTLQLKFGEHRPKPAIEYNRRSACYLRRSCDRRSAVSDNPSCDDLSARERLVPTGVNRTFILAFNSERNQLQGTRMSGQ
jgi:hypothetical protein